MTTFLSSRPGPRESIPAVSASRVPSLRRLEEASSAEATPSDETDAMEGASVLTTDLQIKSRSYFIGLRTTGHTALGTGLLTLYGKAFDQKSAPDACGWKLQAALVAPALLSFPASAIAAKLMQGKGPQQRRTVDLAAVIAVMSTYGALYVIASSFGKWLDNTESCPSMMFGWRVGVVVGTGLSLLDDTTFARLSGRRQTA